MVTLNWRFYGYCVSSIAEHDLLLSAAPWNWAALHTQKHIAALFAAVEPKPHSTASHFKRMIAFELAADYHAKMWALLAVIIGVEP